MENTMSLDSILSIQLYSLRKFGDLAPQLRLARSAGFRQVELLGCHLEDPEETRHLLEEHQLTAPSAHIPLDALRHDLQGTIRAARAIGIRRLYMPALPAHERQGDAGHWHHVGRELGDMAARIADEGIRLGYHNHHWELEPMADGRPALAHFFEAAGPKLAWEVDIAWLARGGADPNGWLLKERARIDAAHVKDIAPTGQKQDEGGWTDVGAGILDWRALWRACLDAGATLMIVEHDDPKHPAAFVQASFNFLAGRE